MRIIIKCLLIPVIAIINILLLVAKLFSYILSFLAWIVIFLCFLVLVVGIFDDMNLSIVLPSALMMLAYITIPMIYVFVVVQLELFRDFLWHLI